MARRARPQRLKNGKWRIRWIDATRKRCSAVYDTFNKAEYELARRHAETIEIRQGIRDAPPPAKTFDDLCDYWLEHRAPHKRSGKDDESILRRHLRPLFGRLQLREIGVQHGDLYRGEKAALHAKTVRNHMTLFVSMLNAALELGWLRRVPPIKKPKVRAMGRDYSYLRTDEELGRFLRAAREDGDDAHVLYAAAVFSGLRQGELAGLTWADVMFERRLIVVQRSFDGPTKADDVRYVPILNTLLPVLRSWRLRCNERWVFPNAAGNMHRPGARIFRERMHRILDEAGFDRSPPWGRTRQTHYITFHDLRHTFASHWVMKGGDIFKLQKILGHKSIDMTMRYAHLQPTAFLQDLNRFDAIPVSAESSMVSITTAARPAGRPW